MHADERNRAMSDALGQDVYHYHLHVVYIPVVEKQILWTKRCKDKSLVGDGQGTIQQVSMSKKWDSKPALDEHGKPLLNANGGKLCSENPIPFCKMISSPPCERQGMTMWSEANAEELRGTSDGDAVQGTTGTGAAGRIHRTEPSAGKTAATLGSKIEKIQKQRVDVRSIEKIVATSIPFSSKVAVEREDFDRISTLAKKYVTAEKKESKLQKAVDAANKLIAKLKAEIDSLKQEISEYKSVRSKLRTSDLERENAELRGKVQRYEDVIQRNNLWHFFRPRREKGGNARRCPLMPC